MAIFPHLSTSFVIFFIFHFTVIAEEKYDLTEIFRDDFNSAELNETKWEVSDNPFQQLHREIGYYVAKNVQVRDGNLVIRASRRTMFNTITARTAYYEAGQVVSLSPYKFLYGVVEWRAKMARGKGFWSGLWLSIIKFVPHGQIVPDIFAPAVCFMDENGVTTLRAFHDGDQSPGPADLPPVEVATGMHSHALKPNSTPEYHVYKMVWEHDSLKWLVDGKEVFWVSDPVKIPSVPLHLAMNVAIGGPFSIAQPQNNEPFPGGETWIDYVSVSAFKGDGTEARFYGEKSDALTPGYVGWTIGLLTVAVIAILGIAGFLLFRRFFSRRVAGGGTVQRSDSRRSTLVEYVYDHD